MYVFMYIKLYMDICKVLHIHTGVYMHVWIYVYMYTYISLKSSQLECLFYRKEN